MAYRPPGLSMPTRYVARAQQERERAAVAVDDAGGGEAAGEDTAAAAAAAALVALAPVSGGRARPAHAATTHLILETDTSGAAQTFIISSLVGRRDTQVIAACPVTGALCYTGHAGMDLFDNEDAAVRHLTHTRGLYVLRRTRGVALAGYTAGRLAVVTAATQTARLPTGEAVHTVTAVQWVVASTAPGLRDARWGKDTELLQAFPLPHAHFYCEGVDLTVLFPGEGGDIVEGVRVPTDETREREAAGLTRAPEFHWNEALGRDFRALGLGRWCVPLLQGYAAERVVRSTPAGTHAPAVDEHILLIEKKSRRHPGSRYIARGLDDEAAPANEVECQVIIWRENDAVARGIADGRAHAAACAEAEQEGRDRRNKELLSQLLQPAEGVDATPLGSPASSATAGSPKGVGYAPPSLAGVPCATRTSPRAAVGTASASASPSTQKRPAKAVPKRGSPVAIARCRTAGLFDSDSDSSSAAASPASSPCSAGGVKRDAAAPPVQYSSSDTDSVSLSQGEIAKLRAAAARRRGSPPQKKRSGSAASSSSSSSSSSTSSGGHVPPRRARAAVRNGASSSTSSSSSAAGPCKPRAAARAGASPPCGAPPADDHPLGSPPLSPGSSGRGARISSSKQTPAAQGVAAAMGASMFDTVDGDADGTVLVCQSTSSMGSPEVMEVEGEAPQGRAGGGFRTAGSAANSPQRAAAAGPVGHLPSLSPRVAVGTAARPGAAASGDAPRSANASPAPRPVGCGPAAAVTHDAARGGGARKGVVWGAYAWRRGTVPVRWSSELIGATKAYAKAALVMGERPHQGSRAYFLRLVEQMGRWSGFDNTRTPGDLARAAGSSFVASDARSGRPPAVTCISLLHTDTTDSEYPLAKSYSDLVGSEDMRDMGVRFIGIDWHRNTKARGHRGAPEVVWKLLRRTVAWEGFAYGVIAPGQAQGQGGPTPDRYVIETPQRGIPRVNCADSLDRTNGCCFLIVLQVLHDMLPVVRNAAPGASPHPKGYTTLTGIDHVRGELGADLVDKLTDLFLESGDILSELYTGTVAAHSKYIRQFAPVAAEKAQYSNAMLSVLRRYQNVMVDPTRADTFSAFLRLRTRQGDEEATAAAPPLDYHSIPVNVFASRPHADRVDLVSDVGRQLWTTKENTVTLTLCTALPGASVAAVAVCVRNLSNCVPPQYLDVEAGGCVAGMSSIAGSLTIPVTDDLTWLVYDLPLAAGGAAHGVARPASGHPPPQKVPGYTHRVYRLTLRRAACGGRGRMALGEVRLLGCRGWEGTHGASPPPASMIDCHNHSSDASAASHVDPTATAPAPVWTSLPNVAALPHAYVVDASLVASGASHSTPLSPEDAAGLLRGSNGDGEASSAPAARGIHIPPGAVLQAAFCLRHHVAAAGVDLDISGTGSFLSLCTGTSENDMAGMAFAGPGDDAHVVARGAQHVVLGEGRVCVAFGSPAGLRVVQLTVRAGEPGSDRGAGADGVWVKGVAVRGRAAPPPLPRAAAEMQAAPPLRDLKSIKIASETHGRSAEGLPTVEVRYVGDTLLSGLMLRVDHTDGDPRTQAKALTATFYDAAHTRTRTVTLTLPRCAHGATLAYPIAPTRTVRVRFEATDAYGLCGKKIGKCRGLGA